MSELLIATNPDLDSRLGYLMRVPLGEGLVLRTSGTWPRTKALFCYPVPLSDWPSEPEIVERVPLRTCVRRGAAVDIVAARSRESRSQLVFTTARGREAIFWQSPRTRRQARPSVSLPGARALGVSNLEIVIDAHERYAYRFADKQVTTTSRVLACGDYGVFFNGALVAAVERKTTADLVASLSSGRLRYALGELAALGRAAVVVEDRYSQLFKQHYVRPALVADGLAECQVRWPNVPIVFCENRSLAEEWTYRFLAAAWTWATSDDLAARRVGGVAGSSPEVPARLGTSAPPDASARPDPCVRPGARAADIRRWARAAGLEVPDRGPLPSRVRQAFEAAWP